jgi:hypothetical protein
MQPCWEVHMHGACSQRSQPAQTEYKANEVAKGLQMYICEVLQQL